MVVLFVCACDPLIPHSDAILGASLCGEFTDKRREDRVRVPVHQRCHINVHVECKRQCFFLEVPIAQELVYFFQFKRDLTLVQPHWLVLESNFIPKANSQMVEDAADQQAHHRVVDDVIEAGRPAVEDCHLYWSGFSLIISLTLVKIINLNCYTHSNSNENE